MNRQLTCEVMEQDTSMSLTDELVHFGFICEVRQDTQYLKGPLDESI